MNDELFERIVSLENLFDAWHIFCKGKRSKQDVMDFEHRLEDNLFSLRERMLKETYCHDPYQPFTIFDPKQRSIHKASVRDRVVHQAVVNVIEPLFETRFIYDSYSCRIGKGTHAAIHRLRSFLRQESMNNTKTVYALKGDIRKFFASVDQEILIFLLGKKIKDEHTIHLLQRIIWSFSLSPNKGIPLGNLTSQLFANVYLHELDRYVKHDLRIHYYLRYCDDFVIMTPSRSEAFNLVERIDAFLQNHLKLQLHPNKVLVRTWKQGIDFLGYILLPHATILRTKTAKRILKRATRENLSSYAGLCQHANAYKLECLFRTKVLCSSQDDIE
jgi:RNA-directed DNA polymerase